MIKLIGVNKVFTNRKNQEVNALKNINLQLPSKGFVLLTGGNGSGKSTLLSILGGLDTVTSGHLMVKGKNFSLLQQHELDDWRGRSVSYVFQDFNILSGYTVAENVALGKRVLGEEVKKEEVLKVLEKVGLQGYENRHFKELSGGERQKVAVARALIKQPNVILVDEPIAHADQESANTILSILSELSKKILVVAVSHHNNLFKKIADRVIVLDDGVIKSDSEKEKVTQLKTNTKKPIIEKPRTVKIASEMGIKSFLKGWSSSLTSVLITAFSLLFFAVFLMLASYNQYNALAMDALNTNHNYYMFTDENILSKDIEQLNNTLGERPILSYFNYNYNGISGIVEVPQVGTSKTVFDDDILYADHSNTADGLFGRNNDKIMITDYLAEKIINNQFIVYTSEGIEYAHNHIFTAESLVNGSVYIRLGINSHEDLDGFFAISAIIGTDWQENLTTATSTKFKYNMIYAPIGFVRNNFTDTKVGDIFVENIGEFKGRVVGAKPQGYNAQRIDGKDVSQPLQNNEIIVSNNLWINLGRPLQKKQISFSVPGGKMLGFTVVGFYTNYPAFNDTVVIQMNENQYLEKEYHILQTTYPIIKLLFLTENVNNDKLAEIINIVESQTSLQFDSENTNVIKQFSQKINIFKNTFLFFAVFSLLLSLAMLYNHITALIADKKKDIGIFRALGARSSTIFIYLFVNILMIALSAALLSSLLSVVSLSIVNSVAVNALGFTIVSFNYWHILIVCLTCMLIAGVATTLPVLKYSKQSPVKQI